MKIMITETLTSKSFKYKTKLIGSTPDDDNMLDAQFVAPLKYLINFQRSLDLPFVNCKIELDLSYSKGCIIFE